MIIGSFTTAQAQQKCETYINYDVPNSRYTINLDQTVTDRLTNLMWAQCSVGRSGSNCTLETINSLTGVTHCKPPTIATTGTIVIGPTQC
jgi:hypothetical protein